MSSSTADRSGVKLARTLFAIAIGCTAASVVFALMSLGTTHEAVWGANSIVADLLFIAVFLPFPVAGVLIASRRPENSIGWLLLAIGIASGLSNLTGAYSQWALNSGSSVAAGGRVVAALSSWLWIPSVALPATFLLLVFPDGHLPSPRWRWFARILAAGMVAASIGIMLAPGEIDGFPGVTNPFGVSWLAWLVGGILVIPIGAVGSAASLVVRFRRSSGDERQQIKWLAMAAGVVGVLYAIALVVSLPTTWGDTAPAAVRLLQSLSLYSFGLIPVAIGISVLKFHLYDLALAVRKGLMFALLAGFITLVYVGIVVGVGAVAGAASNAILSAVAAAAVALAFQPVRRRTERLADRLVYGSRATPYELLSEFSDRVGTAYDMDDVLPRMAHLVADGIGADRAQVWLRVDDTLRVAVSWPTDDVAGDETDGGETGAGDVSSVALGDAGALPDLPGSDASFPVEHHGELLGALAVAMPSNDPMDPAKAKLVKDLASQAGLVLRNVRLTTELQARLNDLRAAQRRLVVAQDHERRKLERNIHDGAQQQLVALTVKLRLAQDFIAKDPDRARRMVAALQDDTQGALQDLRDLARGIYPPLLADKGLHAALEGQIRRAAVATTLLADGIGRYPQDIEAAVYFSCLEALQNVAKYARATRATVELRQDGGDLLFTVDDDGVGFDAAATAFGTGLQGIADRLGAIGGDLRLDSVPGRGTVLIGRVPASSEPTHAPGVDREEVLA